MASRSWTLPDELRQLAESGESDLVQEVLTVFQSDTGERLAALRRAFLAGNLAEVRNQAHTIKGSAGQVGAAAMASLCQQIESHAPAGDRGRVEELLVELDASFAEVCRAMRR